MTDKEIICTNCLLMVKTPGIEFDEIGVCNFCRTHVPIKTSPEEALERLKKEDLISRSLVEGILGSLDLELSDLNLNIDKNYLI